MNVQRDSGCHSRRTHTRRLGFAAATLLPILPLYGGSVFNKPVDVENAANTSGAVVMNQAVMLLGQPLIGTMSNGVHTLRVGAIEGLLFQRRGDFDRNRRLSLFDWQHLAPCVEGPAALAPAHCTVGDANSDWHVDLADFALFQQRFSGGS
jgi:hypothetical protein